MITIENWNRITFEKYLEILSERESYYIFLDELCEEIMPKLKKIFEGILKVKLPKRDGGNSYSSYCKDLCLDLVQEALLTEPEELFIGEGSTLSLDALADKVIVLSEREDLNSYKNISEQESSEMDEEDPEVRFDKRDKFKLWEETVGQGCNEEKNENRNNECEVKQGLQPLTRDQILALLKPVGEEAKDLSSEKIEAVFNERKALFEKTEKYLKAANKYIRDYIKALDSQSKKRFMTVYLYSKYRQDWEVSQRPCQRRKNAQGTQMHKINSRLVSAKQKQIQLVNHYQQMGFWDEIIEPLFRRELAYNGFDRLNTLFEKYRISFSKNVGRDWKNEYMPLLEGLKKQKDFKTGLSKENIKQIVQQWEYELVIRPFFTSKTKLKKPQKTEQLYDRDAIFENSNAVNCCKEYAAVIALLTRQEVIHKQDFLPNETKFQAYRKHRTTCKNCLQYEKQMRKRWIWRFSRMEENMQKCMRSFYPIHKPGENTFPTDDVNTVIKYYRKIYDEKPSDLYKAYLDILYKRSGKKEGFKPTAKNKKEQQKRGSHLGYTLETYCLCGAVSHYTLNALRFPQVIGRAQRDGVLVAHINLCADDENALSRNMLSFKYEKNVNDWQVSLCKGSASEGNNVWYITRHSLDSYIAQYKELDGSKYTCDSNRSIEFQSLQPGQTVSLSEIVGIGIIQCNEEFPLYYHKQSYTGIYHPVLGKLPFGWYIEINGNRRAETILISMLERSVIIQ